jgi:hypothetical protein
MVLHRVNGSMTARFQRFNVCLSPTTGRWPRLLHFAPLALKNPVAPAAGLYLLTRDQNFPASISTPITINATAATRLIQTSGR